MKRLQATHGFPPAFDESCTTLILGSFPSMDSREAGFFYAHPQNRFWRLLSAIFEEKKPETIAEKKVFLLEHHLALYDVIESCSIKGSSDTSIKDVIPANLGSINAPINKILLNGKKAAALYQRFMKTPFGVKVYVLPSTSPANASYSLARLIEEWRPILLDN